MKITIFKSPSTVAVSHAGIAPTPRKSNRRFMPAVAQIGKNTKSKTERARPRITEIIITKSMILAPNFFASHFSNLDGSSSSSPIASAEAPSVLTLNTIDSTKLTTPRIRGRLKNLHFDLMETKLLSTTARVPSSFLQVVTVRSPAFIITPSSTAWPPTLPRRSGQAALLQDFSHFSFFIALYIFLSYPFGAHKRQGAECRFYLNIQL